MTTLLTVREAATILRYATSTVYRLVEEGKLRAVKGDGVRGGVRVPAEAVEDYVRYRLTVIPLRKQQL